MAGRSMRHLPRSDYPLPSLDVRIIAGPLPYGLRRFKLYSLHSKGWGKDLVYSSYLRDHGVLMPREDLVRLSVNGADLGNVLLIEREDDSFFAAAQREKGRVLNYDADALKGEFWDNRYVVEDMVRADSDRQGPLPEISGLDFARTISRDEMLLAQSFAITHAGCHGLGAGDLRFLVNDRSGMATPVPRDLNIGMNRIQPGQFSGVWATLHPLAGRWRPYACSAASYFLLSNANEQVIVKNHLWSTPPEILNFFQEPQNLAAIGPYLAMWAAGLQPGANPAEVRSPCRCDRRTGIADRS